jgi:hypothetical protein
VVSLPRGGRSYATKVISGIRSPPASPGGRRSRPAAGTGPAQRRAQVPPLRVLPKPSLVAAGPVPADAPPVGADAGPVPADAPPVGAEAAPVPADIAPVTAVSTCSCLARQPWGRGRLPCGLTSRAGRTSGEWLATRLRHAPSRDCPSTTQHGARGGARLMGSDLVPPGLPGRAIHLDALTCCEGAQRVVVCCLKRAMTD